MAPKQNSNPLRWLVAAGSVIGFLGGWVILGNASEFNTTSAPTNSIRATNTLVSTLDASAPNAATNTLVTNSNAQSNSGTLTQLPMQSVTTNPDGRVRMRTGGS